MSLSRRLSLSVAFVALALAASLAQHPLRGEDSAAKPEAKPAAKERAKPRGRLPANYGKVVDPLQTEKIYAIQDERTLRFAFGMAFGGGGGENERRAGGEPGKLPSTWRFRE
ncbi:MAG: hypothetical protein ACRDRL_33125 [Sciscionella sp.]